MKGFKQINRALSFIPLEAAPDGGKNAFYLAPKEKTCYTRTSPNFNFLVFFEFLIEFLVKFPD